MKYIASIRPKAEPYGICRIVPPSSWRPPCPLKEKNVWEASKFATRVQRVDKLQNRNSMRKFPKSQNHARKKRRRCTRMGADCPGGGRGFGDDGNCEAEIFGFEPGPMFTLGAFEKYADDFKTQYFSKNEHVTDIGSHLSEVKERWEPSVENIEGEYWRMVEKPTEEIEVCLEILMQLYLHKLIYTCSHIPSPLLWLARLYCALLLCASTNHLLVL